MVDEKNGKKKVVSVVFDKRYMSFGSERSVTNKALGPSTRLRYKLNELSRGSRLSVDEVQKMLRANYDNSVKNAPDIVHDYSFGGEDEDYMNDFCDNYFKDMKTFKSKEVVNNNNKVDDNKVDDNKVDNNKVDNKE